MNFGEYPDYMLKVLYGEMALDERVRYFQSIETAHKDDKPYVYESVEKDGDKVVGQKTYTSAAI